MKLFGYEKHVKVTNKSGGRIAMGKFALSHGNSKEICPMNYSDDVVKALDIFIARGSIEVEPISKIEDAKQEEVNVSKKETIKNDKGETNEHIIFDPESKSKAIEVISQEIDSKSIEVGEIKESPMTKDEAQNFLEQHWKTIEKQLELIKDEKKLEFILLVANEMGMSGNKKCELVEDRINALK